MISRRGILGLFVAAPEGAPAAAKALIESVSLHGGAGYGLVRGHGYGFVTLGSAKAALGEMPSWRPHSLPYFEEGEVYSADPPLISDPHGSIATISTIPATYGDALDMEPALASMNLACVG
jgi:hypothetical protein